MANVLIFDQATGRAKQLLYSVHTPDYNWRADALINPTVPNVPLKFIKVVSGAALEMTQAEKDQILANEALEQQAVIDARDNDLELSSKEIITALIQVINTHLPAGQRITKQELVTQIKANRI